jgi:Tfp pilus assembly protein PilF
MAFGIRSVLCALSLVSVFPASGVSAEPRWIKARLGSFEAISDDGRRSATQALSQFEQFSFALGTVMGQPELRLDPPLRIVVFKNAQDLRSQCPAGLVMGRDRLMACIAAEGQLPPGLLRELTRTLLENNFSKMPAPIETALETFFSTVESTAVHVTWGMAPPQSERTREWALLHRVITQSDYAGKAKIYLHNLAAGMDKGAASRNAFGEDGTRFEADVDQYYAAGVFNTSVAPNRPLNPDRDFNTTFLTSDEGELMRADLLTPASAAIYQSLLQAGKHAAEDNEGLGVLAMKDADPAKALEKARPYMEAARKAGTHNFVALTTYASLQDNPAKAIEILKEALTIDPKYAQAHWIFGEKLSDPGRRMAEWKQAVNLAPRNYEWWAQYARLSVDQKQYAEAGRAWVAAAQAAPNVQLREQYLTARGQIEEQRLDAEDAERRKEADAKARDIDRLKNEARKELADLEARLNTHPLSAQEAAKAVEWFDDAGSERITGSLVRVDCAGKQLRLSVKNDEGQTLSLLVPDPQQFEIKGGESLICGVQKPRRVTVSYKPASKTPKDPKAVMGEATGMEFQR